MSDKDGIISKIACLKPFGRSEIKIQYYNKQSDYVICITVNKAREMNNYLSDE
jgi:hypothetical protein